MTDRHTDTPIPTPAHIGIFDSGIGGLSILRAVRASLPQAALIYFADSAHAPYGERADGLIVDRSHRIAEHLIAQGARLLVVACNTATAAAIDTLRCRWPRLPIVGVEPGLRPAVGVSRRRRVAVMATPSTLRSDRFERLVHTYAHDVVVHRVACPGLAALIENADPEDAQLIECLTERCAAVEKLGADVVVLGCTHYSFVRDRIQHLLGPGVILIDTAEAVASRVKCLAPVAAPLVSSAPVRLMSSGDTASLSRIARDWIGLSAQVEAWPNV